MPRISDILERESRTVDLEQGDFERLLDRRERKERNRRIRAGALGVIVALATGFVLVRSLTSDSVPANPPVEPGAIAYSLDHDDIWVAELDGSNAVQIAHPDADRCAQGPRGYHALSWSPDGRYLAFRRGGCPGERGDPVVIADAQGDVVAGFPAQGEAVAWSPDSTRVAVWDEYLRREGTFTIGIYGIDGTREMRIPMPSGWEPSDDERDPIWTPDGAALIVSRTLVPLDGGVARELPFPEPFAYSPDGSQVAYGTSLALMVARPDGSEPREVSRYPADSVTWSPTGELIAVTSHAAGGDEPVDPNQLRVVDPATGSATLLFEGEPGTALDVIGFSPGGDLVLFRRSRFVAETQTFHHSLWSVGVDGSAARQIVAETGVVDAVVRPT